MARAPNSLRLARILAQDRKRGDTTGQFRRTPSARRRVAQFGSAVPARRVFPELELGGLPGGRTLSTAGRAARDGGWAHHWACAVQQPKRQPVPRRPWHGSAGCTRPRAQRAAHPGPGRGGGFAARSRESARHAAAAARHERLAATVACKAAIKAGEQLSPGEMRALYVALATTTLPAHDVHGRATIVRLGWDELDRRFGRA